MTLDFCPQIAALYEARHVVGRSGKVFSGLSALSTINNLLFIRSLMLELKPARTLEVGMAFGGSALTFAQTHKDLQRPEAVFHTAIDPAQTEYWDDAGRLTLEAAGLAPYVEIIEEYSAQALPKLAAAGRKYGMAYVDGSHQFEDVLLDFIYIHDMLEVGGLILFDDCTDSQVAKVLGFIEANYDQIYQPLPLSRYKCGLMSQLRYSLASRLRKTQLRSYRKVRAGRQNWWKPLKNF